MTQASLALARDEGAPRAADGAEVLPRSDRVLLERHAAGDREAFAELMRTYAPPVYGYLARCGIAAADREDLFQEVFCKVHRALGERGLPDGSVRAWLFAITVNAARDAFRKAKVRSVVHLDERAGEEAADDAREDRPDRSAEARETASFLGAELEKLPLDQREVLVLACVEGLSLEEVAEATDAPVNTVKTRLRRARMTLAAAMKRRGLAADREVSR